MEQSTFESLIELEPGTPLAPLPGQLADKVLVIERLIGMSNGKFLYSIEVRDRVAEQAEGEAIMPGVEDLQSE